MVENLTGEALSTDIQTLNTLFADVQAIWGERAELREPIVSAVAKDRWQDRISSLLGRKALPRPASKDVRPQPGGIFIDGVCVQRYQETLPTKDIPSPILLELCNVAQEFGGSGSLTKIENSLEGLRIMIHKPGDEGEMCLVPETDGAVDVVKSRARAVYNK